MIPKIIHYCWFGPKPLPRVVKRCIRTWHKHLPDYEFRLWNEQNAPMDHPFVRSAYEQKKYAFVADYVRFWALYNLGGVYLDTDMYFVRGIDDLLSSDCFFGWETAKQNIISCGIIGAEKESRYIQKILDEYDQLLYADDNLALLVVPRIISRVLNDDIANLTIYPYDYFYPLPYEQRFTLRKMKYNTPNTRAVHLWNISWGSWKHQLNNLALYLYRKIFPKH